MRNCCRRGQNAAHGSGGQHTYGSKTAEEGTKLGHFNLESALYEGCRPVAQLSYVYRPPRGTLANSLAAALSVA